MMLVELKNISMNYGKGANTVHALRNVHFRMEKGDFLAVTGKSGSGKSTLLNILGGICKPTKGEYIFGNRNMKELTNNQFSEFRNKKIGFVVQHFALIQDMTAFQNIALPLKYRGCHRDEIKKTVKDLAEKLEISDKITDNPSKLSGGQCQRVAIARAIAGKPELLLADEPTGSLDEETGRKILDIFKKLNHDGMTVLIVTHDLEIASACKRKVFMKDGILKES